MLIFAPFSLLGFITESFIGPTLTKEFPSHDDIHEAEAVWIQKELGKEPSKELGKEPNKELGKRARKWI